jgi:hypothetical protein
MSPSAIILLLAVDSRFGADLGWGTPAYRRRLRTLVVGAIRGDTHAEPLDSRVCTCALRPPGWHDPAMPFSGIR